MTILEQRFQEIIPIRLKEISENLETSAKENVNVATELHALNQNLENITDALVKLNETLNYRL